jgi:hypothetical protein
MRAFIFLLALSTISCGLTGPSESLTGHWVANSGDRFTFAELNLQQTGDEISGTACESSAGMLFFTGVAVTGDYPDLQFTVSASQTQQCCGSIAGSQFRGRQDGSRDIVGTYRGRDIRFLRDDRAFCATAKTAP